MLTPSKTSQTSVFIPSNFVQYSSLIGLMIGAIFFGNVGLFLGGFVGTYIGCKFDA